MISIFFRQWMTIVPVLFAFVATTGCSTAALVGGLPDQTPESFEAKIPGWVALAKARPGANPAGAKIALPNQVLLTPIIFNWAPEGLEGRGFPPFWPQGEDTGGIQWLTDEIEAQVYAGLVARAGDTSDSARHVKEAGFDTSSIGDMPGSIPGRAYNGGSIPAYVYSSGKFKQWSAQDVAKVRSQFPMIKSAIYVTINAIWIYEGHAKMNDEAIINYTVNTIPSVKVCNDSGCREAKISPGNPLQPVLFVPAEKATDEEKRKANNKAAVMTAAKYFSGVILSFMDNIATFEKAP